MAVIGGGPIALSWAAYYFMRGFDVVGADPTQKTTANSHRDVDKLLSDFQDQGRPLRHRGTLNVVTDLEEALLGADFIQECAARTTSSKVDLLAEIDKCTRPDSLIASDISATGMNAAQSILHFADRCIIVRPFDLPHLSPFTVIISSTGTSPLAIRQAIKFYSRSGRLPIYLRGQVSEGFTSGLLALFREEAARLRELDIVSESGLHNFGNWAPSLCCSALMSAIQAHSTYGIAVLRNSIDSSVAANFGRSGNRFAPRDGLTVRSNISASPACVS